MSTVMTDLIPVTDTTGHVTYLATLSTSEAAAVTGLTHTTNKAMVKDERLPTSPHSDPTRPRIPANAIRRIADGQ